jgi:Flp pilus assembly protein TadG
MNKTCQKQRGTTMLLALVFLIGLFGAIGLATDSGHILVNKTRLQNALDAAALSAAISVNGDPAHNTANATTAGKATFDLFKATTGNSELSGISANSLTFQYSKYLTPFTPGTAPPSFVKVSTNALPVAPILIQVVGGGTVNVGAQSTAGAVGNNCSLVPFVMCAKVSPIDSNCDDDTSRIIVNAAGEASAVPGQDGINDCFGYNVGQQINLVQACNGGNNCNADTSLETGNFNLLNVGAPGANVIRNALNGTRNICGGLGNNLDTQPGYAWGPVRDGLQDRFNADSNTTQYSSNLTPASPNGQTAYSQYLASTTGNGRREIAAPIGNCTGLQTGNSTIPLVSVGCIFLTKPPPNGGANKIVTVEFSRSCQQNGTWDPTKATLNGPYKIVIFKTAGSQDS